MYNLFIFFVKEITYKIIFLFFIFFIILFITVAKSKSIILYILNPIKKIKIYNFLINYHTYQEQELLNTSVNEQNKFIPIIEINLPFISTYYIYIKYIMLFSFYIMIPIILYYLYINILPILNNIEKYIFTYAIYYAVILIYINLILVQYIIMPLFITFIYSHYNELLFYEFDIELQLINYLNLYFYLLYFNLFVILLMIIKKYLNLNIPIYALTILLILILPFDLYKIGRAHV